MGPWMSGKNCMCMLAFVRVRVHACVYVYWCRIKERILSNMSYTWTSNRVMGFSTPVELQSMLYERDLVRRQSPFPTKEQLSIHSAGIFYAAVAFCLPGSARPMVVTKSSEE